MSNLRVGKLGTIFPQKMVDPTKKATPVDCCKNDDQRKQLLKKRIFRFVAVALSETIGTALLVFFVCTSLVPESTVSHLEKSIAIGLSVAVIVTMLLHISGGHINPAVTIAALLFKLIPLLEGVLYIGSQFIGAILGYGVVMVMYPKSIYGGHSNATEDFCTTVPSTKVSIWQAFLAEYLATAVLIFLVCTIWDKKNQTATASAFVKIGLTISVAATTMGPISGASMNPARTFAPALYTGVWKSHWIYWLGPISASVITTWFYKFVFENVPTQAETL